MAQISFFSDPQGRHPEELLAAWTSLVEVAEAAAAAGAQVSVIQASCHTSTFSRRGVSYHFLPFGVSAGDDARRAVHALIRALAPDILHVHGLGFSDDVLAVQDAFPEVAILLQDHADRMPRFWRRAPMRKCFGTITGVSFCVREQAEPFARAGLLRPDTPIYEIPESTCRFTPGDRQEARRRTGVCADPSVLWVGHLDDNKDPLTVLAGVSEARLVCPNLQMWCCFGSAPLRREVEQRIASDPQLSGCVHLVGRVPHERVEELMRAADVFVLGSHRESTGYALIEAMACGVSPAVTNIPSFRALTSNGTVGRLWNAGDARSLAAALTSLAASASPQTRARVRAHFDEVLSFEALGSRLAAMYKDVLQRKQAAHSGEMSKRPDQVARSWR